MGNVWSIQQQQNCDDLTGDEIYQKILNKLENTDTSKTDLIICCSHSKLTRNQEDMLVRHRDWCNAKFQNIR